MTSLSQIRSTLASHKAEFHDLFSVKTLGCSGRMPLTNSDVAILVEFRAPVGIEFIDLGNYLERILGLRVDLVSRNGIKSQDFRKINSDLNYVSYAYNTAMTRLILTSIFLIAILSYSAYTQGNVTAKPTEPDTKEVLLKIASEIYDAGIGGKRAIIDKYLSDTFLETDAVGELRDKDWNLKNFLGTGVSFTYKFEEPQIREYDRVAVLYYLWVVEQGDERLATEPGKAGVGVKTRSRLRVTDTFIKTSGGWQLISSHRTRLKD